MAEITALIWAVTGLVGVSTLGIFMWRRPDTSLRFKHKDSEIELGHPPSISSASPEVLQLPPAVTDSVDAGVPATEPVEGTEVESDTRFERAYKFLTTDEYEQGIALLKEEAEGESDPQKQVSLLAFGQYLAAARGSPEALRDLRTTVRLNEVRYEPHTWLGAALRELGNEKESLQEFDRAFDLAPTDDERASAVLWSVKATQLHDNLTASIERLLEKTKQISERPAQSRLIARAAKMLLELEPPETHKAFALYELALHLNPADNSLRFDVAYAYADNGGQGPAFFHYSNHTKRDAENQGVLNNLGVAAANLEMESLAVRYYQKAEELGNTLATANLSWKLINAGFLEEARAKVDAKLSDPDCHRNVLEALGGIAAREAKDEQRREGITKTEARLRDLRVRLAEGLASGVAIGQDSAGKYTQGTTTLEVNFPSAEKVSGTITSLFETLDFTGSVVGNGILFEWNTRQSDRGGLWSALSKSGHGLLVKTPHHFEGFTYEGELSLDPSESTGFQEWRFARSSKQP